MPTSSSGPGCPSSSTRLPICTGTCWWSLPSTRPISAVPAPLLRAAARSPGRTPTHRATGAATDSAPGGGQIGALLLNANYIDPGSTDTTGSYNHYSALRSYEDLLGLLTGGADGEGHLGYAATKGLAPFGSDVFPATHGEKQQGSVHPLNMAAPLVSSVEARVVPIEGASNWRAGPLRK